MEMKLFKVIFIGLERGVPSIYQVYEQALDGKDAIHRVEVRAKNGDIVVQEFTKVSLVVALKNIGFLMREPL
jgi:predicted ABC-type transport system involved in lysophospholipase L1 biosynthesis ATPase subunit